MCCCACCRKDEDTEELDRRVRFAAAADAAAKLPREERIQWALERKAEGNAQFRSGSYVAAMDAYVQALTGLDFGSTDEERREVQETLQLPVLGNLAACKIALRDFATAVDLCDKALEVDANNVRALQRRCRANAALERFAAAKADLARLAEVSTAEADRKAWQRLRKQVQAAITSHKAHKQELKRAFAGLEKTDIYAEKKTASQTAAAAALELDVGSESESEGDADSMTLFERVCCCGCCRRKQKTA